MTKSAGFNKRQIGQTQKRRSTGKPAKSITIEHHAQ